MGLTLFQQASQITVFLWPQIQVQGCCANWPLFPLIHISQIKCTAILRLISLGVNNAARIHSYINCSFWSAYIKNIKHSSNSIIYVKSLQAALHARSTVWSSRTASWKATTSPIPTKTDEFHCHNITPVPWRNSGVFLRCGGSILISTSYDGEWSRSCPGRIVPEFWRLVAGPQPGGLGSIPDHVRFVINISNTIIICAANHC
jgi:hypothetical protein